jgi:hypothetical protein
VIKPSSFGIPLLAVKKMLFAGIVFLLVFGTMFTVSGCKDKPGESEEAINPFVGTWGNESGLRYAFTNTVVIQWGPEYTYENPAWRGSYTYDNISFSVHYTYIAPQLVDQNWPNPTIFPYSIENNTLLVYGLPLNKLSLS